jgi:hypothetical protein
MHWDLGTRRSNMVQYCVLNPSSLALRDFITDSLGALAHLLKEKRSRKRTLIASNAALPAR